MIEAEAEPASRNGHLPRQTDMQRDQEETPAARYFARTGPTHPAVTSPTPRRREANGDSVRTRGTWYDYPLPDVKRLHQIYEEAIEDVRHYAPFRAPLLADHLARAEEARAQFELLQAEIAERHAIWNEEARASDSKIDERVEALIASRHDAVKEFDAEIERLIEVRNAARAHYDAQRALAGLAPEFHWPATIDDDELPEPPPAPAEPPEAPRGRQALLSAARQGAASLASGAVTTVRALHRLAARRGEASTESPDVSPAAFPLSIPFDRQTAAQRVRTEASVAAAHGLPALSSRRASRFHALQDLLLLIPFGALLGLSLGIISGTLDATLISLQPRAVAGPMLAASLIGMAMIWVMGRTAGTLTGYASDAFHQAMLNRCTDDRDSSARWHSRTAAWAVAALAVAAVTLTWIEATIERQGIVRYFQDQATNHDLATGQHVRAIPGDSAFLAIALMVSVPYLLFHIVHAWHAGRDRMRDGFVAAHREDEAHGVAGDDHAARLAAALTEASRARLASTERQTPPREATDTAAQSHEVMEAELLPLAPPPDEPPARTLTPEQAAELAAARAGMFAACQMLREARARRRDAADRFDRRVAEFEAVRTRERTALPAEEVQRLEDAYSNFTGAVFIFDQTYEKIVREIEQRARPGLIYRLYLWLLKKPAEMR